MKKKPEKKNKGSALLIALVIMMVVMMLSLALLLVSYSLASTASRQKNMEQCKEAAQSLSTELEKEITMENKFQDYAEQEAAESAAPLWYYLRYNVWQTSWPYYNSEEAGHSAKYAYRYFKFQDTMEGVDDISILAYWESEEDAERVVAETGDADENDMSLNIQVTCTKGKQKSVITSVYALTIDDFDESQGDAGGDGDEESKGDVVPKSAYNPDSNWIYSNEKWSWNLVARR